MQRKYSLKFKKLKRIPALVLASVTIGVLSALLTDTLKLVTEHYEGQLYDRFQEHNALIIALPFAGFIAILLLRHFLFRNTVNKGMREAIDCLSARTKYLPAYKIPSHYFNGFLTVIFGGSTGIEVSTVVATATVGSLSSQKTTWLKRYKNELICAGIAAGITALFNAPAAGVVFALEVFAQKINKRHLLSIGAAALTAYAVNLGLGDEPVFHLTVTHWNTFAMPYFVLLGIFGGIFSTWLTRSIVWVKDVSQVIENTFVKILLGSVVISVFIFIFPNLYGEGYASINAMENSPITTQALLSLAMVLMIKPVVTSLTLTAGGDGGVFAPSLFMGAFLGFLMASLLNTYFHAGVIPVNFIVIGMAALLSGSIHAPLTSIFLLCAVTGNYTLFVPIVVASVVAKIVARLILPYTVYSYSPVFRNKN
ncbi:chloride channel protein, CIC family [Chryseolinea serpens]|uniref:Chloride channel protein, CIC family n=1 Tax=Chryseolinea serpens TaxID=947013 RepID=A0A1M5VHG1_9BACT|nr:chloride channel protein [Chryseolinea serpens]SHH74699.1 chloride channel protein, CIC family [Chryseolinea serpens]